MKSSFEVGDNVTIDGGTTAQIVKVINNEEVKTPLYLVQDLDQNQFTYILGNRMSGSEYSDLTSSMVSYINQFLNLQVLVHVMKVHTNEKKDSQHP